MIRSGQMRHRVTIERQTTVRDSVGALPDTWTTVAEVWAILEPLTGQELQRAQAIVAEATHRITFRYRADMSVTPKDRVIIGTRKFDIARVENMGERGAQLNIVAVERF